MQDRPLFMYACVFLTGILFGRDNTAMKVLSIIFVLICLIINFYGKRIARSILLLAIFLIGIAHISNELEKRREYLSSIRENEPILLQGEIYKQEEKNNQHYYYLKDCIIQFNQSVISGNRVQVCLSEANVSLGNTLLIKGNVRLFSTAKNEGEFDTRKFYQSQKIDFSVVDATILENDSKQNLLQPFLSQLKSKLSNIIKKNLSEENAGILCAMLLGEKAGISQEIRELYQKCGISHILAISGLHISLLGMGIYKFIRKRGSSFLFSGVFVILLISAYGIMTGNSISIVRAIGMLGIYLLAKVLGRTYDMLNAMAAVLIVVLLGNPFIIDYSGFVLSFAAILAIAVCGERFVECLITQEDKKIKKTVTMNVAITYMMLPIVAFYYYEIPTYSILVNLVVLAIAPILIVSGFLGCLLTMFFSQIGMVAFSPATILLWVTKKVCTLTASLPFTTILTGQPGVIRMIVYYGCLLIFLYLMKKEYFRKYKRYFTTLGLLLLTLILVIHKKKEFELSILDVGQGDGIYYCSSDGLVCMIDGGSSSQQELGTYTILPFLKYKGISTIDYWFVSHCDLDHISGLEELLDSDILIKNIVFAKQMTESEAFTDLLKKANQKQITVRYLEAGDVLESEQVRIECLSPDRNMQYANQNEASLVLKIIDDKFEGIFAGDISSDIEQNLIWKDETDGLNFYKAIHHGSNHSNGSKLLEMVSPDIVAISCGANNRYGHPGDEALYRMEETGAKIVTTAQNGQITIKKDKKGNFCVFLFVENVIS